MKITQEIKVSIRVNFTQFFDIKNLELFLFAQNRRKLSNIFFAKLDKKQTKFFICGAS